MREIYPKAEMVLSWLGHGIDEIDEDLCRAADWLYLTKNSIDNSRIQKPNFLDINTWLRFSNSFHIPPVANVKLYKIGGLRYHA
jgi:hypothetical protein